MPCLRRAERNFGCGSLGGSKVSSDALLYVVIDAVNFCGLAVLGGCSFWCGSALISGVDFDLSKLRSEAEYLCRDV